MANRFLSLTELATRDSLHKLVVFSIRSSTITLSKEVGPKLKEVMLHSDPPQIPEKGGDGKRKN